MAQYSVKIIKKNVYMLKFSHFKSYINQDLCLPGCTFMGFYTLELCLKGKCLFYTATITNYKSFKLQMIKVLPVLKNYPLNKLSNLLGAAKRDFWNIV